MPPIKGVPVTIGGERRTLRYTARALDRLENETGLSLGQIQGRARLGNFRLTVSLIWVGLLHEDKELSRDTVLDWLEDLSVIDELASAIDQAMAVAYGEQPESETKGTTAEGKETAASVS